MGKSGMRGGETLLEVDPGGQGDASVAFIGVVRSDWQKGDCPRNIRQSRERGGGNARIELKPGYGAALAGPRPRIRRCALRGTPARALPRQTAAQGRKS